MPAGSAAALRSRRPAQRVERCQGTQQAAPGSCGSAAQHQHIRAQQQLDQVLLYLGKHGSHVGHIQLKNDPCWSASLFQLPGNLRLSSLQLESLCLHLRPHCSIQGVLGDAAVVAGLKQGRLRWCQLFDDDEELAAALMRLPPGLEHLSIYGMYSESDLDDRKQPVCVPVDALQQLLQLTFLELSCSIKQGPDKACPALQPLTALTRLVDLRLHGVEVDGGDGHSVISAAMLSGAYLLTRLQLSGVVEVEPGVLTGKTKLQHLQLVECVLLGRDGEAQLLSRLQPLQQLTHLSLRETLRSGDSSPASYSALTASSKLEDLDISWCKLPDGVWQHVFPAGRQLPQLRWLNLEIPETQSNWPAEAPGNSSLVSCCPSLQDLNIEGLQCTTELLVALRGLSGLRCLRVDTGEGVDALPADGPLTELRELFVACFSTSKEGLLLQPTQLKQLTGLTYLGPFDGTNDDIVLEQRVSAWLPLF